MPSTAAIVPIQRVTWSVRVAVRVGWRNGVTFVIVAGARSATRATLTGRDQFALGRQQEQARQGWLWHSPQEHAHLT